jgi:hypothetical protein
MHCKAWRGLVDGSPSRNQGRSWFRMQSLCLKIGHSGRAQEVVWRRQEDELFTSRITLLVREGTGFYNPCNTALESVVGYTRSLGTQPPNTTVVRFASGCLNIERHFGNSQEH